MSSSTESMPKGEEKKGNSKNYPNDEIPKETTTEESNRSKTSSMSEQSKMQPVEKKQLIVLTMNAESPKKPGESTEKRRKAIVRVINTYKPDLVLFQEFKHLKTDGKTWFKTFESLKEQYNYTGSDEASIMYKSNEFIFEEIQETELKGILDKLPGSDQKNISQESKSPTTKPEDFDPIPRMSLSKVKTKGVPVMEFICISWHGEHRDVLDANKVAKFTSLMLFLKKISETFKLPILIAGDFNVKMDSIKKSVPDPFKLYQYEASKRRQKKGVIDYFIASKELHLSDIKPVDLTKDSTTDNPEKVLDHDPIIAKLQLAPPSDTASPLDDFTDTNRPLKDFGKLNLPDMTPVDLKKDSTEEKPEEVLDHDPNIAMLQLAPPSDTDPPLDEVTVTNRTITDFGKLNLSDRIPVDVKKDSNTDKSD